MKKCSVLVIIVAILLLVPLKVDATTINDYKNKIATLEKEKAESEAKSEETQKKIDNAEARIAEITRQIVEAQKSQKKLKEEIAELEKEIKVKDQEIKELMTFYQVSENDNFYLKFVFGAESFEDFIYRFSVAEQLTDANDKLVDEMNDLITKNEKKVKELKNQEKKLNQLNEEISKEISKLGNQKKKYEKNALTVDEEIETLEGQIKYYRDKGCGDNEEVSICSMPTGYGEASSDASALIPSASGFIRPLAHGYITSYYGGRIHPIFGTASYHSGVDIAQSTGTTIMASNKGQVVWAGEYGGFGNCVMVYHGAAGYEYTTLYGHMSSISVYMGQAVSRGQKLGEVGSTGWSTGPHLHFQAMYGNGYNYDGIFDPMNLVYMPVSW